MFATHAAVVDCPVQMDQSGVHIGETSAADY